MNNEFNQNTRTLIVSFVFAVMVMIPLRFVEVGNTDFKPMVLGDSIEAPVAKIEAPYDVIETSPSCLAGEYVDQVQSFLLAEKEVKGISELQIDKISAEIVNFESQRCQ